MKPLSYLSILAMAMLCIVLSFQDVYSSGGGKPFLLMENKGQIIDDKGNAVPNVLFFAESGGAKVFIEGNKLHFQFRKNEYSENREDSQTHLKKRELPQSSLLYQINMELVGSQLPVSIKKEGASNYFENYYLAHCPNGILDVRGYEKITFSEVYPNIDWVLYIMEGKLKYDFVVKPGGNPSAIRLNYLGADRLDLMADGNIYIKTPFGEVQEQSPLSYQRNQSIDTEFMLKGTEIQFRLGEYSLEETLVIDPVLVWVSGFDNNSSGTQGLDCDADNLGNVYMSGQTYGNMLISGGHQIASGGSADAFLIKYDASGNPLWGTYYGGEGTDVGNGCAVDNGGNIYLTGDTYSESGISFQGYQNTYGGPAFTQNYDAFLVKFNELGIRQWATYYGGNQSDYGNDCAVDAMGNIYMAGTTSSSSQIAFGGFQSQNGGGRDAFLVKFGPTGNRIWSTYYGGYSTDVGAGCATDDMGNVVLCGQTGSTDHIAKSDSHQQTLHGFSDAFLVTFSPSGTRLWCTYYGGDDFEEGTSCAIDTLGNVYLSGNTASTNNIAANGHQMSAGNDGLDAFLVKFNISGIRDWGTFYGGSDLDYAWDCEVDKSGNVYLTGESVSLENIRSSGYENTRVGGYDVFLAKFNTSGIRQWGLSFGTAFIESGWYDSGRACTVDDSAYIYVAGVSGASDGFASLLKYCGSSSSVSQKYICQGSEILEINGTNINWSTGASSSSITVSQPGTYYVSYYPTNGCAHVTDTFHVSINNEITNAQFTHTSSGYDVNFNKSTTNIVSTYWDFGDGSSSFVSDPTHTYLSGGTYTACLTVADSCGVTDTECDEISIISMDVDEAVGPHKCNVYPNPGNGKYYLTVPENATEFHVSIVDIQGRNLYSNHLYTEETPIDLSSLNSGIYFLTVTFNGDSQTLRIVHQP